MMDLLKQLSSQLKLYGRTQTKQEKFFKKVLKSPLQVKANVL